MSESTEKIQQVYQQAHTQAHEMGSSTRTQVRPFAQKVVNLHNAASQFLAKYTPAIKESTPSAEGDINVLTSHLFTASDLENIALLGVPDQLLAEHKETLIQLKMLALNSEKKYTEASPQGLEALQCENAQLRVEAEIAKSKLQDKQDLLSKAVRLLEKNGVSLVPLFEV